MTKLVFRSILVGILGLSMLPISFAAPIRTSNMNQDIVINEVLFNALSSSVGKVPNISASEESVALTSGNDKLECDSSACSLSWDSISADYPQRAAIFENSLYDALENWATHEGNSDPSVHRSVFVNTGSTRIVVSGDPGTNQDLVQCSAIHAAGSIVEKSCTLVVSDYSTDTGGALQDLYDNMLKGQTLIGAEIQSLLNTVKSSSFLAPGNPSNGNGVIQVMHTLSTGFIIDNLVVSANYAYVTPVLDGAGQVLAHGITLSLTGYQDKSGAFFVQQAHTQTYALSHIIPLF